MTPQQKATDYCFRASEALKAAGFQLCYVSRKTESCYYTHPIKPKKVIRISTHARGKSKAINSNQIIASVTYPANSSGPRNWTSAQIPLHIAVGRYFLFKETP